MPPRLHFWRTLSGSEIDFVVSTGAHLIPIEVKAGARAGSRETRHLKVLEKPRVRGWRRIPYRILFHSGELQELGRDLWAIPFWFLG